MMSLSVDMVLSEYPEDEPSEEGVDDEVSRPLS